MVKTEYSLSYLPMFYEDLEKEIMYIAEILMNSEAANGLIDMVEQAIIDRLPVAESFEPYYPNNNPGNPYYRIYVNNYTIYYVVIENDDNSKTMEVRRFLNNLQYRDNYL